MALLGLPIGILLGILSYWANEKMLAKGLRRRWMVWIPFFKVMLLFCILASIAFIDASMLIWTVVGWVVFTAYYCIKAISCKGRGRRIG